MAIQNEGKAENSTATFVIYKDEKGGEPLWIETQNVSTDAAGRYEVYLGSTYSSGLPPGLFGTGEARWLEVQIAGQTSAPTRTLLTSVPYALKAADAATLGGLPASAFVLASSVSGASSTGLQAITPDAASNVTTTGGTNLYLPRFSGTSTIVNSEIYDTGTAVGIGNVPNGGVKLDVNGAMIMLGNMTVSRSGNATTSKAYPSFGFDFFSNVYNSSTKAGDNPYFQLQSEPTGNNTASPSATFNLLFANNGSAIAETGFSINPTGTINFASGQTYPGTITGITTTSPLTGSGTSGSVSVGLNTSALETTLNGTYAQLGAINGFKQPQIFGDGIYVSGPVGIGTASPAYDTEIYDASASSAGLAMVSGGTDAAISVNNTASGGREYWIDSGSGSSAVGAGNFAIYDNTAGATRLLVDQSGAVSINAASGRIVAQLAVLAQSEGYDGVVGMGTYGNLPGPSASYGSRGVAGYGASTDNSSGTTAGEGGIFEGGNADSTGDAAYGIYVAGGSGDGGDGDGTATDSAAFASSINVNGNTVSDATSTKIDHPSDPANKYLNLASVQSSEMMNMYTGNVTTDGAGHATVALPAWFEAENADFRYQLTVFGQFAQAIVKDKISNGHFTIMTNAPSVEVSWLVTAVRQDAYAKAHPLLVEEAKPAREVGFYRHPELYGQPATKQTEWGRKPRMMQRSEAQRAAADARKPVAAPAKAAPLQPHASDLHHEAPSSLINAVSK